MLKLKEASYLALHDKRRIYSHLPPHFEIVQFDLYVHIKDVTDWIHQTLEGRFYVGPYVTTNYPKSTAYHSYGSNGMQPTVPNWEGESASMYVAGFEEVSEASYFALLLDTFNSGYRD
jgi:hypothetical protein